MSTYHIIVYFLFFFNDTATTEIYTLSLHDALPIFVGSTTWCCGSLRATLWFRGPILARYPLAAPRSALMSHTFAGCASIDRKSTRLNSSHGYISYAVFCLKKKKNNTTILFCTPIPT